MIIASARIVERTSGDWTVHPYGFEILDGPQAGLVFVCDGRPWWRVGERVTVTYHPDDQFAQEVK